MNRNSTFESAPPWRVERWLNTKEALSLERLRGKVVVLHAFQMLCPGCVLHGLPQAQRINDTFEHDQVAVIGLHTLFEHHNAITAATLKAFVHEYQFTFPVGMDASNGSGAPKTMTAYRMQGTPTLVLIDKQGKLRSQIFGQSSDLSLGAEIMSLILEK